MKKQFHIIGLILSISFISFLFLSTKNNQSSLKANISHDPLAARFDYLSKAGNSTCSAVFKESILEMSDSSHIQGSCCSPMDFHRYTEQINGLKKYKEILEIPSDPYDVEAGLAKKLIGYYDMKLNLEEQKAYDYAMQNSHEKGPCCCKCWRWYVYGGLGKYLILNHGFTGEQLTDLWNLSDGCGGSGNHAH